MNLRSFKTIGRVRALTLLATVLTVAALLALGCSSETTNSVGNELVGPTIDTLLVPMNLHELNSFGNLLVEEDDRSFDEMQLLYFGNQGGESSSLLLRYDFAAAAAAIEDAYPDTVFYYVEIEEETWELRHILREDLISADNVEGVELRFYFPKDLDAMDKSVVVEELAAQLDPSLYPNGVVPPADGVVGRKVDLNTTAEDFVSLDDARFLEWWQAGSHNGLLVSEADDGLSDDGLTAVASKENLYGASAFDTFDDETAFGPVMIIYLVHPSETEAQGEDYDHSVAILPSDDLSTMDTFDAIPDDPMDGFTMRTHQRNYPFFSFDLSGLPDDVLINGAELWVGVDTVTSYGPVESFVVAEIDSSFAATPGGIVSLDDLCNEARVIDGRTSFDAAHPDNQRVFFDVTSSCQRLVNSLLDEPFRFLLGAGEDCFSGYDMASQDPDFYLVRFNLEGTSASPALRPHLQILYSGIDDLSGGGK